MESGGSTPHSQELSNNFYPEPDRKIPHTDIYFINIHRNIVLSPTPKPF